MSRPSSYPIDSSIPTERPRPRPGHPNARRRTAGVATAVIAVALTASACGVASSARADKKAISHLNMTKARSGQASSGRDAAASEALRPMPHKSATAGASTPLGSAPEDVVVKPVAPVTPTAPVTPVAPVVVVKPSAPVTPVAPVVPALPAVNSTILVAAPGPAYTVKVPSNWLDDKCYEGTKANLPALCAGLPGMRKGTTDVFYNPADTAERMTVETCFQTICDPGATSLTNANVALSFGVTSYDVISSSQINFHIDSAALFGPYSIDGTLIDSTMNDEHTLPMVSAFVSLPVADTALATEMISSFTVYPPAMCGG